MNITFLIGNGFDLNCGLKTRFRHVYDGYCKTSSESKLIEQFKKDIDENYESWGDFEVAMSKYMVNFENEQDFLTCLRDFKSYLNLHLKKENDRFIKALNKKRNEIINEMRKSVYSFNLGITHDIDRRVTGHFVPNIIVFNYTPIWDTLFPIFSDDSPHHFINHIHGELDDDLVMGMDNINQFKGLPYELTDEGRLAFIKSEFNQQYDPRRINWAENTINDSDFICVFGMSLGESDLRWRKHLLDWLISDENAELFIYQHRYSVLTDMFAEQRMAVERTAKKELLQSWGIAGKDLELFSKRIHIPCCRNIFNIRSYVEEAEIKIQGVNVEPSRLL